MLERLEILNLSRQACERYGVLVNTLRSKGEIIGDLDILIGSIALTYDQAIITRNQVEFKKIPGLMVETYLMEPEIPAKITETESNPEEVRKRKQSYFGAAQGIGPFTKEDEMKAHD